MSTNEPDMSERALRHRLGAAHHSKLGNPDLMRRKFEAEATREGITVEEARRRYNNQRAAAKAKPKHM